MSARVRLLAMLIVLALGTGLGATVAAAPAAASSTQTTFFEAPNDLLSAKTRPHAIAQLQSLGVHALRIVMYWEDVALQPNSNKVPRVNLSSPTEYDWGQYAALIDEAAALHWTIMLDVSGPVPKWATAAKKDHVTRPNALEYEDLMTAVGKEFGSKVALFSIWNEPNHPFFLMPQFNSNRTPASPMIYRSLWQAGYAGLQKAGLKNPRVLMGETAPTGFERTTGPHDVAPITFLQGTLCLNSHWQKASTCALLPAYGWAHHAYSLPAGPYFQWSDPNDVTIGSINRLTRALDLAARAHAIHAGMPVYLTEFGWQTKPNNSGLAVSYAQQAQFEAISEHIAYLNGRVAGFSQYLLRDDPVGGPAGSGVSGGYVGFQTGLETVKGAPKPSYNGFRLPLTVTPSGHGFQLWGLVRPATGSTHLQVIVLNKHSRKYVNLFRSVTTNSRGYWTIHTSDTAGQQFEVRWRAPNGTLYTGAPTAPYK